LALAIPNLLGDGGNIKYPWRFFLKEEISNLLGDFFDGGNIKYPWRIF